MLTQLSLVFRRFRLAPGGSMQHGCDMKGEAKRRLDHEATEPRQLRFLVQWLGWLVKGERLKITSRGRGRGVSHSAASLSMLNASQPLADNWGTLEEQFQRSGRAELLALSW